MNNPFAYRPENEPEEQRRDDEFGPEAVDHEADDDSADDDSADAVESEPPVDPALAAIAERWVALEQRGQSGANWFYWIAGLSLVNSAIILLGGQTHFVIGLAVTLIVDVIAIGIGEAEPALATIMKVVAGVIDLTIALAAMGVGYLASRRWQWVFLLGMGVYACDGVIFLLLGDLMSAGFHGFALFWMFSGWNAFRELGSLERQLNAASADPFATDVAPA